MSAPPSISPAAATLYVAASSSKVMLRCAGFATSGESEAVRPVGPIDPATKRGFSGVCPVHASAARLAVYSATKAALQNLTLNAAKEYAPDGITFNSIVPGIICTDRNRKILSDPDWLPKLQAMVPAGRFGVPEDCAGAVLLLASEAGSYITGAEIPIAGGMQL